MPVSVAEAVGPREAREWEKGGVRGRVCKRGK